MYAIIRLSKLHGRDITASDNHCHRKTEVLNADPALTKMNMFVANKLNGTLPLSQAIEQIIEREKILPRKNAVKCVEMLMSMPPELWAIIKQTSYELYSPLPHLLKQWVDACISFIESEPYFCGGRTFLDYHLHLDVSTPNIHLHLMPGELLADGKIKLNAKKYFGGRIMLRMLQDRYHAHMAKSMPTVGFQRGIPKEITGKSHVAVKEYYRVISLAQKAGLTPQRLESLIRSQLPSTNSPFI